MSENSTTFTTPLVQPSVWQVISKLFKLRIVSLLLFAAVGGAFLGAAGSPTLWQLILLLITGGLASSGASALNQYLERNSDGDMKRTSGRPLVDGTITNPEWVLWIALAMVLLPVTAVWPFNPALAFFLLMGAIIYVAVYTIWLKPRTMLNIVIGGAAGSCAVLSGGAAVGAWSDPGVLALAAIVFLWTPTHFWALALMCKDDYAAAGVPMLPVLTSPRESAVWGLVHAIGVAIITVALGAVLGWVYLVPAGLMTAYFLTQSVRLVITPTRPQALRLFMASNFYLALILLVVCIATVV
ncbi:MAG: protoheme IX farnesyltransferase [Anaerolineales bacterium]|nr:protoheme IX farnesyltransferase [Anaerolineales bacterium]